MRPIYIEGGSVLLPEGLAETSIRVEDGVIASVDARAEPGDLTLDARGLMVAPGLVDIHGDAFERQVMPRPGVFFPLDVALTDTDRQLAAAGITTAYHALTLSWAPGLRAIERGEAFVDALDEHADRLTVDHCIQLRWETFAFEAEPLIERVLESSRRAALAFNDHTSMTMRADGIAVQDRLFEHNPDFAIADYETIRTRSGVSNDARRAGLGADDYANLMFSVWERRPEVPKKIQQLGGRARAAGAPMLSHDDTQLETRDFYRETGARIAEFPMRVPVAEAARDAGDAIVFGAPNVVRGGSHIGSPGAADMVEAGLCDILASDYYYPAMKAAAGRLVADGRASHETAWKVVSTNAAKALDLTDRGELIPGSRADIVLLDWTASESPLVRTTLSAGRIAYLSGTL